MMRIRCLTLFKDGTHTYQQGDIVTVEEKDGYRFVGNGWAVEVVGSGGDESNVSAELSIHSSKIGVSNKGF
jgi:hypothetical protein